MNPQPTHHVVIGIERDNGGIIVHLALDRRFRPDAEAFAVQSIHVPEEMLARMISLAHSIPLKAVEEA